jgi:hypothetical protein
MHLGSEESDYEYICYHVDDLMIVSKRPERIMEEIQRVYAVRLVGPPEYYLGSNNKEDN